MLLAQDPKLLLVDEPVAGMTDSETATTAELLREIAVDGSKTYFDTNLSNHHHFLVEDTQALVDIPGAHVEVSALPDAPAGMEIDRVDVIIRLRRK